MAAGWRPDTPGDILGDVLTLTGILIGLAVAALALAVAAFVVPGIECDGPVGLLLAALLYQGLSVGTGMLLPLAVGDLLGPFGLVGGLLFGTLILWLVGQIVPGYRVEGFGSALLGAIMVVLAGFAAGALFMFLPGGPLHPTS